MRCGWWGSHDGQSDGRTVGLFASGVLRARGWRLTVRQSDGTTVRRFPPGHRTVGQTVGSVPRRQALRPRHRRRQRRRDPGDREADPLYLRLQPRRLHLPHHGFHVRHESGDASAGGGPRRARQDRAAAPRRLRAAAWRLGSHGSAQAWLQPRGLLCSVLAHRRCGSRPDARAAALVPRGAARRSGDERRRRPGVSGRARTAAPRARPAVGLVGVLELVAGVLLTAGLVYFVLRPVLRPTLDGAEGEAASVDEGDDPDDDLSPRAVALRALKEIEFDRATGKLSDADYDALKAKYAAEALTALRAEGPEPPPSIPSPVSRVPRPSGSPSGLPACPEHGPRQERDAEFCSECGRRVGSAPGYCARCGAALEHDARYCHACGARVAA